MKSEAKGAGFYGANIGQNNQIGNGDKPLNMQQVTGRVNMGMSDTASGKHGSNKRG